MRREAMVLGHPRLTFPLKTKLRVQSIGSGAKYPMVTESFRGWDINAEFSADVKPGYNPLSLLEIWIEDGESGAMVYGFAKYIQALGESGMMLRIVEIDPQGQAILQKMLQKSLEGLELEEAAS